MSRHRRSSQTERARPLRAGVSSPQLVPACTYPLTGVGCVSRVYTDHGVFDVGAHGVRPLATYGVSVAELRSRLDVLAEAR
jgi:acyl CoA:acetate/3-ketoacid CoA transferase beta subunit